MRIRLGCLVLVVLLVPTLARADDHWADLYAAFSGGDGASKLFGFHEAVAKSWPGPTYSKRRKLSIVVSDLSVQFASHDDGTDVTQVTFLFGGRYTPSKREHKAKVSFHGLLGGVNTNEAGGKHTDFAGAVGFGFEYLPRLEPYDPAKASKPHDHAKAFGFRAQVDRVIRKGGEDFWRVSGGVVFRIDRD